MKLHRVLVIGFALALAACGGGGGGGGSPAGGSNVPATGGTPSDGAGGIPGDGGDDAPGDGSGDPPGDGGGETPGGGGGDMPGDEGGDDTPGEGGGDGTPGDGGGGAPTSASRAEIVFPWVRSAATAPTVTVRGIAADPEGVASVIVNGVPAAITRVAAAASTAGVAKGQLAEGEVEWSAEIALDSGDNQIVVAVEDESGEITESAASSTITYVEVPVSFNLDTVRGRIVGLSYTLTPTGYAQHLIEHELATGSQEVFDTLWAAPESSCFRAVEDQFLYLQHPTENVWELRQYDLGARAEALLFQIPSADLDPGPDFQPWLYTLRLECDSNHTSAYLLVNYVGDPNIGFEKARVLEIPLDGSPIEILTETDTGVPEPWVATDIALTAETLVAQQNFVGSPKPLTSISLADGTREDLTPGLGVAGLALAPALESDRVYVATLQGVDEVDISVPSTRNISEVEAGSPVGFYQVREVAIDSANNRILVGDSDLDAVVAVDLATGERTKLIARNVGEGTPLIAPRAFALTADGLRAYVADDGGNAPARLFEIDLTAGDRTEVGEIAPAIADFVTGLALDEAGGRVFVSADDVVIAVDLETGFHETIVDIAGTDLESISDILLDAEGERLLIVDAVLDGLYALDLVTRDLDVVSRDASRGSGPAFDGPVSISRVGTSSELFVANQGSESVMRADLETGDREELAHSCATTTFAMLNQVLFSEPRHELLISGDNFFSVDLESGECTSLPRRVSPLQIRTTSDDQLLAVSFRTLLQIDRATGEVAIVSK